MVNADWDKDGYILYVDTSANSFEYTSPKHLISPNISEWRGHAILGLKMIFLANYYHKWSTPKLKRYPLVSLGR